MTFLEHCKESIEILGKPYCEVHLWLDEFAGSEEYGMKHRRVRHHLKGVKEIIKMFGEEAGNAAKLHIISDLYDEGYYKIPKDEKEYVKIGLF